MDGVKVLVVDDDVRVREVLCTGLKTKGYEVVGAGCTAEALIALESFAAEVVLTDILMPGGNGAALINQLRASAVDVKILAMSGGGEQSAEAYLQMSEKYGVDRTLMKPLRLAELDDVIRSLVCAPTN